MTKPKKKYQSKEKQIQNLILDWLKAKGIFCWQNDSVGIYDPVKKIFRRKAKHALNGVSDILGCWHGRFFAIEVKSAKGQVSDAQAEFMRNIELAGGIAFEARSLEDVTQLFVHGKVS